MPTPLPWYAEAAGILARERSRTPMTPQPAEQQPSTHAIATLRARLEAHEDVKVQCRGEVELLDEALAEAAAGALRTVDLTPPEPPGRDHAAMLALIEHFAYGPHRLACAHEGFSDTYRILTGITASEPVDDDPFIDSRTGIRRRWTAGMVLAVPLDDRLMELALAVRRMLEDGHPDDQDWFRIIDGYSSAVNDLTDAAILDASERPAAQEPPHRLADHVAHPIRPQGTASEGEE